ncbi:MAG: sugar transferase [Ignavibacteria bacterium]
MTDRKKYLFVKRINDILISIIGLVILFVPMIFVCLILKLTAGGPVFHRSRRFGKDKVLFNMVKLRTMKMNTPIVPTEELENPEEFFCSGGKFLRKYGIDEVPQLINVIKGEMSFVGPRPALYNHNELVKYRELLNVNSVRPGLTGLAQINGRNNLSQEQKVKLDNFYSLNMNILLDYKIIFLTVVYLLNINHGKGLSMKEVFANSDLRQND